MSKHLLLPIPHLIVFVGALSAAACGGDEPPKLSEIQTTVFTVSCTFSACHAGANPKAALSLEAPVYDKIVNKDAVEKPGAKLVVPGDPDASFLMDKLLNRNLPMAPAGETWGVMPLGGMLEADRIENIRAWIAAGANND
ncbi:MAG: hypothetical protein IT384_20770 [Deltaproteobacteria bacterium]|nr:hypothetical protein [Deltaproteobacteria bacterium]